jgi:hypothetical protein
MLHWDLLKAPAHRLIGAVVVQGLPENASNYTARLTIYEALDKDLLPPKTEDEDIYWFEPMGLVSPDAPLRALRYEHVYALQAGTNQIPIRLPDLGAGIFRCFFDVISPDGATIASTVPAELYEGSHQWEMRNNAQKVAWIADSDATAKQIIASQAGMNESFTVDPLPTDWRDLQSIRAIWLNRETPFDTRLLRRVILSGRWILGHPDELKPIHQLLGTAGQHPILYGGIGSLTQAGPKIPVTFESVSYYHHYSHNNNQSWPLENDEALFSRIRVKYLTFTLLSAGIYALCATIFLPIFFRKLSGNERLQIWWKTPLIIGVYSIIILFVGFVFVQPKRPITNVTEYRFGYADWPEVFCTVNFEAFQFGAANMQWHVPPGSMTVQLDKSDATRLSVTTDTDDAGNITLKGVSRGLRIESDTGYFRQEAQPFSVSRSTNSITIHTERNLRNIHLALGGGKWLAIGDMPAGESIKLTEGHIDMGTLTQSQEVRTLHVEHPNGIPQSLESAIKQFGTDSMSTQPVEGKQENCTNCGRIHKRSSRHIQIIANSVILIALDENEKAAVSCSHPDAWEQSRVAWIAQVPITEATAAPQEEAP